MVWVAMLTFFIYPSSFSLVQQEWSCPCMVLTDEGSVIVIIFYYYPLDFSCRCVLVKDLLEIVYLFMPKVVYVYQSFSWPFSFDSWNSVADLGFKWFFRECSANFLFYLLYVGFKSSDNSQRIGYDWCFVGINCCFKIFSAQFIFTSSAYSSLIFTLQSSLNDS